MNELSTISNFNIISLVNIHLNNHSLLIPLNRTFGCVMPTYRNNKRNSTIGLDKKDD